MNQTFSLESALDYCEIHKINMLFTEQNYLDENAVFKLYSVKEDLLIQIMIKAHNGNFRKTILPVEILRRNYDAVIFDISSIKKL
jgi:hypothetical protein